jgi:hypothetical protein
VYVWPESYEYRTNLLKIDERISLRELGSIHNHDNTPSGPCSAPQPHPQSHPLSSTRPSCPTPFITQIGLPKWASWWQIVSCCVPWICYTGLYLVCIVIESEVTLGHVKSKISTEMFGL